MLSGQHFLWGLFCPNAMYHHVYQYPHCQIYTGLLSCWVLFNKGCPLGTCRVALCGSPWAQHMRLYCMPWCLARHAIDTAVARVGARELDSRLTVSKVGGSHLCQGGMPLPPGGAIRRLFCYAGNV